MKKMKMAARVDTHYEDEAYDNTFKRSLRKKCSKVNFVTIKICQLYNLLLLNWYLLGVEINLGQVLVPFRSVLEIFRRAPPSL